MKLGIFSIKQYGVLFLSLMTFSLYSAPNCVQVTYMSKTASTVTYNFDLTGTGMVTDYTIIVKTGSTLVGDFRYSSSTAVALNRSLGSVTVNSTNPATVNFTLSTSEVLDVDGNEFTPFICAVALPIELLSFQGQNQGKSNLLTWQTANEQNVDFFDIEKSINGIDFKSFLKISAKNGVAQSYQTIDENPYSGTTYYRLKMVDKDGSFTYSLIRSVVFNDAKKVVLKVYPNPAYNSLTIDYSLDLQKDLTEYTVINMFGQTLLQGKLASNNLDISNLPMGAFVIKVGESQSKFFKQ